jgi:hypothetical protein
MKNEAEDFVNRHMYDQTKGWPVLSRRGTEHRESCSSSTSENREQDIDHNKEKMPA